MPPDAMERGAISLGPSLEWIGQDIDRLFDALLPVPDDGRRRLYEAMRHAAIGGGKRMRPLTATRPKPLVEVAGKPLIDHVFDRLRGAGIGRVIVNVHYLADALEAHLAGTYLDMEVLISDERDRRRRAPQDRGTRGRRARAPRGRRGPRARRSPGARPGRRRSRGRRRLAASCPVRGQWRCRWRGCSRCREYGQCGCEGGSTGGRRRW